MNPNEYKCAECGGVFDKGWTDQEAAAELKANFGSSFTPAGCDVVCDDCYEKTHPAKHPHLVEECVAEELRKKAGS